jgi:vacuolar-type H+-ATPase subunit F/Vma7
MVREADRIEESQIKFYEDLREFLDILKEGRSRQEIMYITQRLFEYLSTTPYSWEDDSNVRPIVLQLINNTARASTPTGRMSSSGMLLYSLVSRRLNNELN